MSPPHDRANRPTAGVSPPFLPPRGGHRRAQGGCRSPVLLGLVLLLVLGACCVFGVASGALISELWGYDLSLGAWLGQRQVGQGSSGGADATPGSDRQPIVLPADTPAGAPQNHGLSQTQPTDTPVVPLPSPTGEPIQAAAPPAASAPKTVNPPAEQSVPALPRKGLPANQPTRPASRLVIPSLGVDVPVVLLRLENGTWDISRLTQQAGHLQGTAAPGDPSNVALAGHVTLAKGGDGPFKNLAQLRMGEDVLVYSGDQVYRYAIESVRVVAPDDVEVTFPTARPTLTLITCANWDRARRVYDQRIVAVGHLVR
jgi:LPXTG-site transpeptidase (sortase) family protein